MEETTKFSANTVMSDMKDLSHVQTFWGRCPGCTCPLMTPLDMSSLGLQGVAKGNFLLNAINSQKAITGGTPVTATTLPNSSINSQRFHLPIKTVALTALSFFGKSPLG